MHVTVDLRLCAASGACARVAPDVFELPPGGPLRVVQTDPPEALRQTLMVAQELCPTGAISCSE